MSFSDIVNSKENVLKYVLYLPTNEQQEFLELGKIMENLIEKHLGEIGQNGLSEIDEENKQRYIFLLKKAKKLSTIKIEERLGIFLLSDQDEERYFELSNIFQDIMNEEYNGDIPESDSILKEYENLGQMAKKRYQSRSIL